MKPALAQKKHIRTIFEFNVTVKASATQAQPIHTLPVIVAKKRKTTKTGNTKRKTFSSPPNKELLLHLLLPLLPLVLLLILLLPLLLLLLLVAFLPVNLDSCATQSRIYHFV